MSSIHQRRLKTITFNLSGVESPSASQSASPALTQFECQVKQWMMNNNTADGDKVYTFCPDGEDREEADDDYSLALTFFADWRVNGISGFLTANDGKFLEFVLDHHPDIDDEHVRWTGECKVKAPSVGGEVRATEEQSVTYQVRGKPEYERIPA